MRRLLSQCFHHFLEWLCVLFLHLTTKKNCKNENEKNKNAETGYFSWKWLIAKYERWSPLVQMLNTASQCCRKKTSKITKYTKLKQNLTEGDLDFSCPVIQEQFAASMSTHTYSIYTRAGVLQKMPDEDNHWVNVEHKEISNYICSFICLTM